MKSTDISEKTRKNVIVHHYQYNYLPKDLMDEIQKKEDELIELKKKVGAKISIWLPNNHPVFGTKLLHRNKKVEWSTHTMISGKEKQIREIAYVESINENADITQAVDQGALEAIDFSDEPYTELRAIYYGNDIIVRLSGCDVKDISKK